MTLPKLPISASKVEINGKVYEVPHSYICPITLEVMVHPLMTRSGLHFERSAILSWLNESSGTCPLTRKPMRPSDMIPDTHLETQLRFWRMNNGIDMEDDSKIKETEFVCIASFSEMKKTEVLGRRQAQPANNDPRTVQGARWRGARSSFLRRKKMLTVPSA
jgi:hypothetical protein